MRFSLLPFISLLSIATAIPVAAGHLERSPRTHERLKNRDASVVAAVAGLGETIPSTSPIGTALLVNGASVDLLPVKGNSDITDASYKDLTTKLPSVLIHAIESSTHSWEIGSLVESLLEVYVPRLAPFNFSSSAFSANVPWAALWVVEAWLNGYDWSQGPSKDVNVTTVAGLAEYLDSSTTPTPLVAQPLINGDGALGDPVALGQGVWLLARYAQRDDVAHALSTGVTAAQLAWAAGNQLAYLRSGHVSSNGTISQRESEFQLWADMGSMIPPYPAYIGVDTGNEDLLSLAIDQWILESSALLDESTGLYRHINDFDAAFWATGNGWMTHGAVRVMASVIQAGKASKFSTEIDQVKSTLSSVFTSLFNQLNGDSLLPNYMLNSDSSLNGSETAGTALVVAAYYRFIHLYPALATSTNTAAAAKAFAAVVGKVDADGWLTSTVNPMGPWVVDGAKSPEGQSFVGMMWAARTVAGI